MKTYIKNFSFLRSFCIVSIGIGSCFYLLRLLCSYSSSISLFFFAIWLLVSLLILIYGIILIVRQFAGPYKLFNVWLDEFIILFFISCFSAYLFLGILLYDNFSFARLVTCQIFFYLCALAACVSSKLDTSFDRFGKIIYFIFCYLLLVGLVFFSAFLSFIIAGVMGGQIKDAINIFIITIFSWEKGQEPDLIIFKTGIILTIISTPAVNIMRKI